MGVTDNFDEFVALYHHRKTDIDMYLALTYILNSENICNKKALDEYCENVGRKMLYNRVKNISHTHWNKIKNSEREDILLRLIEKDTDILSYSKPNKVYMPWNDVTTLIGQKE